MLFVLTPYVWQDGEIPGWIFPAGARQALDLRTLAQMGTAGGPGAASLFTFERAADVPKGSVILTDDPDGILTQDARNSLSELCGFSRRGKTVQTTRFSDVLFEALTTAACAPGLTGPRPIMPTRRALKLNVGPISRSVAFDIADPELSPSVLAVLKEDFRAVRALALDSRTNTPADLHQKVLGYWLKQYRTDDPSLFQPEDLERTEPKEPATVHTESFDKADSSTLGPDLTWTELLGTVLLVKDNRLGHSSNSSSGTARAEHDLSSSDNYAEWGSWELSSAGASSRAVTLGCRYSSASDTCYRVRAGVADISPSVVDFWITKLVSGVGTNLIESSTIPYASPQAAMRVEAEGSTVRSFYNGSEVDSITDTAISAGLRGGIPLMFINNFYSAGQNWADDFEVGDLDVGGGTDDLTPDHVSTGAPSIDSPALGQVHALAPSHAGTAAPSIDSPALGQVHALAPSHAGTAAPSIDSPALGQVHALAPSHAGTAAPSIDSPALGQVHALAPSHAGTAAPSIDSPALGQVHALAPSHAGTAAPSIDSPALGQVHALAPSHVSTGAPSIDQPIISSEGTDALAPDHVSTGAPSIDSPALGQVHALAPSHAGTAAPSIDSPALGQVHALAPSHAGTAAPSIDSPALGQVHALAPDHVSTGAPDIDAAILAILGDIIPGRITIVAGRVSGLSVTSVRKTSLNLESE